MKPTYFICDTCKGRRRFHAFGIQSGTFGEEVCPKCREKQRKEKEKAERELNKPTVSKSQMKRIVAGAEQTKVLATLVGDIVVFLHQHQIISNENANKMCEELAPIMFPKS